VQKTAYPTTFTATTFQIVNQNNGSTTVKFMCVGN